MAKLETDKVNVENKNMELQKELDKIRKEKSEKERKINDVKQKYEKAEKENIELNKKLELSDQTIKCFEEEKKQYVEIFEKLQTEKTNIQNKNTELQNELDKLRKENYEKEIIELKKQNQDMAIQLNEMKINLLNKNLSPKSFKAEMIKPKRIIDIIFQHNKEEDKYEMVIKGKNKKESDENINLLDIDSFLINNKDKNRVDIVYTVSITIFNFIFIV